MYKKLHEAWKRERENIEIQKIPKDFYTKLAGYVKRIREEKRMLDERTVKGKLLKREHENIKKMIKEFVRLRYRKSLRKAATGENLPKEFLAEEEAKFHGEILPLAEAYHDFMEAVLRGRNLGLEGKGEPDRLLVRFLREIPAVVGSDMKPYGPFKPEDIATLPVENARALLKQGAVVEVHTN